MRVSRVLLAFAGGSLFTAASAFAQPEHLFSIANASAPPRIVSNELIVLLRSNGPSPEEVVEKARRREPLPGLLGTGDPIRVDFGIKRRAKGVVRQRLLDEPDRPRARLERYIVLEYPRSTSLEATMLALEGDPNVQSVEPNGRLHLHLSPSDPLAAVNADSTMYQWGIHALNLPAAWDLVKGNAYLGLIDTGLEIAHPELRAFDETGGVPIFDGGPFREHFSYDYANSTPEAPDCVVDEVGLYRGHGSHVSGIAAARTDNALGVAGACWHCSIMMMNAFSPFSTFVKAANSLRDLVDHGVQIVSISAGQAGVTCDSPPGTFTLLCDTVADAEERDVVMVASAGNDRADIEFPASDVRVISAGGVESDGSFWDEWPDCPRGQENPFECGSNYTKTGGSAPQDLVAPAKSLLSTVYTGFEATDITSCGEASHPELGFGLCTGTSMSSPFVAGIAALVRSTNPLLDKVEVRDALVRSASGGGTWHSQLGYGVPDAGVAAARAVGLAGDALLPNRLTPLFALYSYQAKAHLYTTVPQMASAAIWDDAAPFLSDGTSAPVQEYPVFPGNACTISPCFWGPTASAYVFTTDRVPVPGGPALIPLYRMRFDPNLPTRCVFPLPPQHPNRVFTFVTNDSDILTLKAAGYVLDGIEGYAYELCGPEPGCIPEGAERLYRLYHPNLGSPGEAMDDFVIFPESELGYWQSLGYGSHPSLPDDWIGYVYPNLDSDGDTLIDGFESLIGTDTDIADSDCDGLNDGAEGLGYGAGGYDDPLRGPCAGLLFADGFETGDTSRWSPVP